MPLQTTCRFKIIINLATAALGVLAELFAVFKFGSTAVDAIIPVFTVGRILEAAKDLVLLFTTGQWPQGFPWMLQVSDAVAVMAAQAVSVGAMLLMPAGAGVSLAA